MGSKRRSPRHEFSVRRLAFPGLTATWDVVGLDSLRPGDAILLYAGEPDPVAGSVVTADGIERILLVGALPPLPNP